MFQFIKCLLIGQILLLPAAVFSISKSDFSVKMISGPLFHSDQNECTSDIGPRAVYVAVEICNQSNVTQTNVSMLLTGFTSAGYALAGGQDAQLYLRSPFPAGTCDTLYWFCTYPCTTSTTNIEFELLDSDDNSYVNDTIYTVSSSRELSASAGGFVRSSTLSLKDTVNHMTCFQVTYGFSKLVAGDQIFLQPVANLNFRADCFQLKRANVLSSDDAVSGCIPVGPCPMYYSIQKTCGTSPSWTIVVEYCFKVRCPTTTTAVIPYASATSGNDLKYTIAPQSLLLPLNLLQFEANANGKAADIIWKTADDEDVLRFEVERSADAIHFETIHTVSPAGNARRISSYAYTDENPAALNYYRLKITEDNGSVTYSALRSVRYEVSKNYDLVFYPNPVRDKLQILDKSTGMPPALPAQVMIADAGGNIVSEQMLMGGAQLIDFSRLPGGLYFIGGMIDNTHFTTRIVKE